MDRVRDQFPALRHGIYANTPASGLLYDDLLEWRQSHELDQLVSGSEHFAECLETIETTRHTVARCFNAMVEGVSLVPNFSIGMNLLMENQPGSQRVLLVEDDYPSVNWPFEDRGFDIEYVKVSTDFEDEIAKKLRTDHFDILALSVVQWLNGVLVDLDFIAGLKTEFPDLLIIGDGTQFCGMFPFNFNASGFDVLGASGYKWMLGGYGGGFLLIKPSAMARFTPRSVGFGSVVGDMDKREGMTLSNRLEPGHLNAQCFGSMDFSLKFMEKIGLTKIGDHNTELSRILKETLAAMGLIEDSVVSRTAHSTIFSITNENDRYRALRRNDVVCSLRGGRIRVGFHFYNTFDEIARLVKILKKLD